MDDGQRDVILLNLNEKEMTFNLCVFKLHMCARSKLLSFNMKLQNAWAMMMTPKRIEYLQMFTHHLISSQCSSNAICYRYIFVNDFLRVCSLAHNNWK